MEGLASQLSFRRAVETTLLGLVLGVSVGCAPTIIVDADEGTDFSSFQTWGWHAHRSVGELPEGEHALARSVAAHIEQAMTARGFRFAGDEGQLVVKPTLSITRRHSKVQTSRPDRYLASHHWSGSYVFEGLTVEEVRTADSAHLQVEVWVRATGRKIWHGELRGRFPESFSQYAEESVVALMTPFPETVSTEGRPLLARSKEREAGTP